MTTSASILPGVNTLPRPAVFDHGLNRTAWCVAVIGIALGAGFVAFGFGIAGGAVAVLGLAPLFVVIDRKTVPGMLAGPCMFMYLSHVLGYSIGPLAYLLLQGYVPGVNVEGLAQAQEGAVLGLVTFAICYPWIFRAASRRLGPRFKPMQAGNYQAAWPGFSWVITVPALCLTAYGSLSGAYNRLNPGMDISLAKKSFANSFAYAPYVAFFFLGYGAVRRRWAMAAWLCVYIVFSWFFLLDGARGPAAWSLLFSCIGMYSGGLSARKLFLGAVAFAVVFVPLSTIVVNYRNLYQTHYAAPQSLSERWTAIANSATGFLQNRAEGGERGFEAFLYAISVHDVDRVFWLTPGAIPFAGFDGIENVGYVFIPQMLSPNRPNPDDIDALVIMYGGEPRGSTGAYFTAVGDGYRRFGWAGIPLLYAWLAVMWAGCCSIAWTRRHRLEFMAMFVLLIYQAPGIWSCTLPWSLYVLLWVFPKYMVFFLFLRAITGLLGLDRGLMRRTPRWPGKFNYA